ncbi:MAG: UvrD-helicase domain-containing protein [Myxococcota bacterium]|nr:UvrD-helicase domain-containing protein [Myxococcota bacterium]
MIVRYPKPQTLLGIQPNRHCVIEASAGTGKTYTLEHLVVDLLLTTPANLDNILVVTFTDKATRELKKRIRSLIETVIQRAEPLELSATILSVTELQDQDPNWWYLDEHRRNKLEQQLFSFESAPIQTMHGFCKRVLSEVAFAAHQHLDQTRVDSDQLFDWAWQDRLAHLFLVHDTYRVEIRRWLSTGEDLDGLKALVASAHRVGYLSQQQSLKVLTSETVQALSALLIHTDYLHELSALAIQPAAIRRAEEAYATLLRALGKEGAGVDWTLLQDLAWSSLLRPALRAGRSTQARFPDGLSDDAKAVLDAIGDLARLHILHQGEMQGYVDVFLPAIAEAIHRRKSSDGLFEFDDLLTRVCEVLDGEQGPRVIDVLNARYNHALIDEFQDTDRRQWHIFRTLFVDHGSGQLCVIGDPKQAIYGFRGADVQTYLDAREIMLNLDATPATQIQLQTNFRTTNALIHAVNQLLIGHAESPFFTGRIDYSRPVTCGRPTRRLVDKRSVNGDSARPITLFKYDPPQRRQRRTISGWRLMNIYASAIVDELSAILDRVNPKYVLVDGHDERPLNGRDIFILVRTKREGAYMADVLRKHGYSCVLQQTSSVFETEAAKDVWTLLRALEAPENHGRRMAAFSGPFFPMAWNELKAFEHLDDTHPYVQQIIRWRTLVQSGQFGQAFRAMQFESGFIARQILDEHGEQQRIDVEHVFERLIEWCGHARLTLTDLIRRLEEEMHGHGAPDSADTNKRRLPLAQDAIQIMTLHKSKGLEAQCVFLFGGFLDTWYPPVRSVRYRGHRLVLMGEPAVKAFAEPLRREARYEDERLYYVGLTRAGAKLYLPYVSTTGAIAGPYQVVNRQVYQSVGESVFSDGDLAIIELGGDQPLHATQISPAPRSDWSAPDISPTSWSAPPSDAIRQIKAVSAPLLVTSYSTLKQKSELKRGDDSSRAAPENIDTVSAEPAAALPRLPGGKNVGRCLHEIIELTDLRAMATMTFEQWCQDPSTTALCHKAFRRHRIEERHLVEAQALIFQTLTTSFELGPNRQIPALCHVPGRREVEFIFPMPEIQHALLSNLDEEHSSWHADRGFIKGYIDFVFEDNGQYYWVDWKSDLLAAYDSITIDSHVRAHYQLQANLYSLSCTRLIGIEDEADFQRRFGGFLYVFLRGIGGTEAPPQGVYYRRPTWEALQQFERALISDPKLPPRRQS